MKTKICAECKKEKDPREFYDYRVVCKKCVSEKKKKYKPKEDFKKEFVNWNEAGLYC